MIVTLTAARQGVGASTLATLLAKTLSKEQKVLLVDLDEPACLDLYTGLSQQIPPQGAHWEDRIQSVEGAEPFDFLHCQNAHLDDFAQEAPEKYDIILLDLGNEASQVLAKVAKMSPELLFVINQDNACLRRGDGRLAHLSKLFPNIAFVVNEYKEPRDNFEFADLDEIFGLFEETYLGKISYNEELRFALNQGELEKIPKAIDLEVNEIIQNLKVWQEEANSDGLDDFEDEEEDEDENENDELLSSDEKMDPLNDKDSALSEESKLEAFDESKDETKDESKDHSNIESEDEAEKDADEDNEAETKAETEIGFLAKVKRRFAQFGRKREE